MLENKYVKFMDLFGKTYVVPLDGLALSTDPNADEASGKFIVYAPSLAPNPNIWVKEHEYELIYNLLKVTITIFGTKKVD